MLVERSPGMKAAPRFWKRAEGCFPLRGRWLRYFLVGVGLLAWFLEIALRWGDYHPRTYWASSPPQPYVSNNAPHQGLDCQKRMLYSFRGEIARTLRIGDLVFEVAQEY